MANTLQTLLIEDSPADAALLKISLSESVKPVFQIHHRTTLTQGLEFLQTQPGIEVVLLDLSLPDATGERTVTLMREAAPHLPIVIMTGHDNPEFADKMLAHGAQDYIVKGNFDGSTVVRSIRYAITRMHQSIERELMLTEMRNAVDMKNKMFGILAHDLRSPIGAISGWVELTEMLEGETLSDLVKKSNLAITESTSSMNALIEDVLAVAVSEAGTIKLNYKRFNLIDCAYRASSSSDFAANAKSISINVMGSPIWICADEIKIQQIVNNLIGNAIKFSNQNGTVDLSVTLTGDTAQICVCDYGVGIPPSVMSQIFQPFCKGQKGTAGERTNGLGLYICSMIATAHKGTIEVDSVLGNGTKFTVNLPVNQPSNE